MSEKAEVFGLDRGVCNSINWYKRAHCDSSGLIKKKKPRLVFKKKIWVAPLNKTWEDIRHLRIDMASRGVPSGSKKPHIGAHLWCSFIYSLYLFSLFFLFAFFLFYVVGSLLLLFAHFLISFLLHSLFLIRLFIFDLIDFAVFVIRYQHLSVCHSFFLISLSLFRYFWFRPFRFPSKRFPNTSMKFYQSDIKIFSSQVILPVEFFRVL